MFAEIISVSSCGGGHELFLFSSKGTVLDWKGNDSGLRWHDFVRSNGTSYNGMQETIKAKRNETHQQFKIRAENMIKKLEQ
ncbi:MAG: hypothetical protein KKD18_07265 [Nanoarchaeota archaeon]|nr:hypothetical protein [Nanoarchaeota archaeon]